MTRDEGPPKDEVLDLEPQLLDDVARDRERSAVRGDAHDRQTSPSTPNKRRARGTDSEAQAPSTKTESWIDAFNAQCTRKLMKSLYCYTARLLSGARRVAADSAAALELVQAAILDMLNGPDHWDFAEHPLDLYLKTVIKRQVLADLRRAKRLPHVSIEELTAEGQRPEPEELEQALRDQRPDPREVAHAWSAIDRLCRRAAGDGDVVALIYALANDRTSRAEVMAATGFSERRYRAALRRLNRIADEVGIELDLLHNGKEQT